MEIRTLREDDDRSLFDSGDVELDRFFKKYAGQNQFRHHIGTTYIAVEGDHILGFATVSPGHIEIADVPATLRKKLPRYPLPILRLARLAVDRSARNLAIGKSLLHYVFRLALRMAADYGCSGVVVDAKPDAIQFYTRFGFTPLEVVEGQLPSRPQPAPLFLPIRDIASAAAGPGSAG